MLKLVSKTNNLILPLNELKSHLNIDGDADDCRLEDLLKSATSFIEREVSRDLTATTWDEILDKFPSQKIELPRPPLASVTSVTYFDANDSSTVLGSSTYYTITPYDLPGFVKAKTSWPVTYDRPDSVTIRFVSGYTVPTDIAKHTVKIVAGWLNENREADSIQDVPGIDRLLYQLRTGSYA